MTLFCKSLMALLGSAALVVAQGDGEKGRGGEAPRGPGKERGGPKGERDRARGGEHRRSPGGRPLAENFMATHDHDKDKAVTFDEFKSARKMEHLGREGKQRIFNHLDKNKDGKITREELPKGRPNEGPRLWGDVNRDGKITLEEFSKNPRLKNVDPERVKAMFARMDPNQDGVLSREDFGKWRRRGPGLDRGSLEKLDQDGDKALSFEEWKSHPRLKDAAPERLKEMFERLDRNNDGKLNQADWPGRGPGNGPDGRRRGPGGPPTPPPARRGPGTPPPGPEPR